MNNFVWIIQNMTIDQLKTELKKSTFAGKDLRDYIKCKKIIDDLFELIKNDVSDQVKKTLLMYCMIKKKEGN